MRHSPTMTTTGNETDGVSRRSAEDGVMLAALLKWGFPLVGLVATLASQILIPRILQVQLSSNEYISYVAVSATVGYLSLADGGMQVSIMRELSVLHSAADRSGFAGEVRRARRVFTVIALIGCVVAGL